MDLDVLKMVNDELREHNRLVETNYFRAKEKIVRKRIRYGIDCRNPDYLLCKHIDYELFELMFGNLDPGIVRAIFISMW